MSATTNLPTTPRGAELPPGVPLVLDATSVSVSFRGKGSRYNTVVDSVGLGLEQSQVTVLLGESGSGKTVFARSITGMAPRGARVAGAAVFSGQNLLELNGRELRKVQGNRIGMVPQDPNASLDPMRRVGGQIIETLMQHGKAASKTAAKARMLELLELVHIHEPERVAHCYPHEVSGGMRQRIAIAIAICCDPELIVADEPSSALDASVGVRVVQLLDDLRERLNTAILFITHDIGIAALIASTGTVGFVIDAVVGVAVIVWIFWRSRRNAVHASNAIVEVDAAGFAVRGRKATKAARKAREAA